MWEKYNKRRNKTWVNYSMAVFCKEGVRLSKKAIHEFSLRKDQFAELYYDRDTRQIGIKILNEPTKDAYKLFFPKCYSHYCMILAMNFPKFCQQPIKSRFSLRKNIDINMIIGNLIGDIK